MNNWVNKDFRFKGFKNSNAAKSQTLHSKSLTVRVALVAEEIIQLMICDFNVNSEKLLENIVTLLYQRHTISFWFQQNRAKPHKKCFFVHLISKNTWIEIYFLNLYPCIFFVWLYKRSSIKKPLSNLSKPEGTFLQEFSAIKVTTLLSFLNQLDLII